MQPSAVEGIGRLFIMSMDNCTSPEKLDFIKHFPEDKWFLNEPGVGDRASSEWLHCFSWRDGESSINDGSHAILVKDRGRKI